MLLLDLLIQECQAYNIQTSSGARSDVYTRVTDRVTHLVAQASGHGGGKVHGELALWLGSA